MIKWNIKYDMYELYNMQTSLALILNENVVVEDEKKIISFTFAHVFLRPSFIISFVPSSHNYTSAVAALFILFIVQNSLG